MRHYYMTTGKVIGENDVSSLVDGIAAIDTELSGSGMAGGA